MPGGARPAQHRRSCWGGRGFGPEHDLVAQRIEAANEALGGAVLVDAVEVIAAEIGEGDRSLQHVEHREEDLVGDRHRRLLRAHPRAQPVELAAQIAAPGP
jgi:hypothetical protein